MGYPCSGFEWKAVTFVSCPDKLCCDGLNLEEEYVVADGSLFKNQAMPSSFLLFLCPLSFLTLPYV